MTYHYIIWPEKKYLSDDQIRMAYDDAKANKELANDFRNETTILGMIDALNDAGIFTFARCGQPKAARPPK